MIHPLLLLCILLITSFGFTSKNFATSAIPTDSIVGTYKGPGFFNHGSTLKLMQNRDFVYNFISHHCTGGGSHITITGKYKIENNKLVLLANKVLKSNSGFARGKDGKKEYQRSKETKQRYRNSSTKIPEVIR